jgi:hypothetical protein
MAENRPAAWDRLFLQTLSIIRQVQLKLGIDVDWSFGGGTALMLQIDHRDSFDIDIFIDDPQILPFLNARTQGHKLDIWPDDYQTDGTKVLKLVFTGLGEIDFICAAALTETPAISRPLFGETVRLETPAEIIAKKIFYRGLSLQPRDMFDVACVAKTLGDQYLRDALRPFANKAAGALAVAKAMNPSFATTVMQQLRYRPAFSEIPGNAQALTIRLLESVCGPN